VRQAAGWPTPEEGRLRLLSWRVAEVADDASGTSASGWGSGRGTPLALHPQ